MNSEYNTNNIDQIMFSHTVFNNNYCNMLRKNQKHISKTKLGNRFETFLVSHREVRHKKNANVLQNGRFDILYCRPRTTITRWNQYLMIVLYTQSSQKTGPCMASYLCTWETVIFLSCYL